MGVRKKRGARGRHACSFLRPLLRQGRILLPITFKRVKCSNLLLCIMINSPTPPLLPARSLHIALFPLVHYFLYTRGKCVTIRAVHKTLQRRDSTPPTLHPFSSNPLREKNFVPGHLGEIVAFVLKTKWRFGVYQY